MNRTTEGSRVVIEKLLAGLPVKRANLDNGSEFSEFRRLEERPHTLVYFTEPHKPMAAGNEREYERYYQIFLSERV